MGYRLTGARPRAQRSHQTHKCLTFSQAASWPVTETQQWQLRMIRVSDAIHARMSSTRDERMAPRSTKTGTYELGKDYAHQMQATPVKLFFVISCDRCGNKEFPVSGRGTIRGRWWKELKHNVRRSDVQGYISVQSATPQV
jgi:hypothetical protein